ncbi:MAG: cobalamin-binding protein [Casimicrobiaceae bacterium]
MTIARKDAAGRGAVAAAARGVAVLFFATAQFAAAEVSVVDDTGATVTLAAPARRIVSLAPHVTELLFAAGAGERIVGAVEFSDYPEAAKAIPRIGSSTLLDMEQILALKPDLVVVWRSGTAPARIEALRGLGIPIYFNEPHTFADIAQTLVRLGKLAGSGAVAQGAADALTARVSALRERYAGRRPVTVFWQIWARPLLTVNREHVISDAIRLCGGVNVFADLTSLVPAVSVEAVVAVDPEAIVTTGNDASVANDDGLAQWRALPRLRASARGDLIVLDAETIHRPSPRVLDGAAALCTRLDTVRARDAAAKR